jgi:hypothetical protein
MNKTFLFLALSICTLNLFAQSDSTGQLTFSGYVEAYYGWDVNKTPLNERPDFLYNYRRSNEVAVNFAYLKAAYTNQRIRGNLALMSGTYAQYNLAAEPSGLQYIYEANIGIQLSATKNLWLDAGVLPSHLGLSNPIGKDWWNVTRTLACEGSPYYETGLRLQYITDNHNWLFGGYIINGWQHMQLPFASKTPAFGTQVTYTPSSKFSLNYSTFIGNEFPDSARKWRFFNNVYALITPTDKLGFALGFDVGMQQQKPNSDNINLWFTPYALARYKITSKWFVAGRLEYYHDNSQIIVVTYSPNGFQTLSYSANLDYQLFSNAVWRIEGRVFNNKDAIFSGNSNQYIAFTTSLAIAF